MALLLFASGQWARNHLLPEFMRNREERAMRQISILLTRYADWFSNLVYYVGGQGFTHCSIALEENQNAYYSFNYRGFTIETLEKHKHQGVKNSRCIQLRVPDEAYAAIKHRIQNMLQNRSVYRYTRFGVFCCVFHLPFRRKYHYFCSQFVAELLLESGAVPLKRPSWRYLPNRFAKELPFLPACCRVQHNVI